jgi:hypothetical protein
MVRNLERTECIPEELLKFVTPIKGLQIEEGRDYWKYSIRLLPLKNADMDRVLVFLENKYGKDSIQVLPGQQYFLLRQKVKAKRTKNPQRFSLINLGLHRGKGGSGTIPSSGQTWNKNRVSWLEPILQFQRMKEFQVHNCKVEFYKYFVLCPDIWTKWVLFYTESTGFVLASQKKEGADWHLQGQEKTQKTDPFGLGIVIHPSTLQYICQKVLAKQSHPYRISEGDSYWGLVK